MSGKLAQPAKYSTITLNYQGQVDGTIEAFEVNGMMAVPMPDGVAYVRWKDVQAFFPQARGLREREPDNGSAGLPTKDMIAQVLLETQNMSDGLTADALLNLFSSARSEDLSGTSPKDDNDAFEKTLTEHGIASNYQGDGIYGAQARRLHQFFLAGADHGRSNTTRSAKPDLLAENTERQIPSAPLATKLTSDPLDPDDGVYFSSEDWQKLEALPAGSNLYATMPLHKASFQHRTSVWVNECFGTEAANNIVERYQRFVEESLELAQSLGCSLREIIELAYYVYHRPAGKPYQEVGGVRLTLAALCQAAKLDETQCGEMELARVWTKIPKIKAKQAAKPKHSALPGTPEDENRTDLPELMNGWYWMKHPDDLPPVGEWLCKIRWDSGKEIHQVLDRVNGGDHDWRFDSAELSHHLNVVAYMAAPMSEPKQGVTHE